MTKEEFIPTYLAKRDTITTELLATERKLKRLHDALKDGDDELAAFLGVVHTESGGNGK